MTVILLRDVMTEKWDYYSEIKAPGALQTNKYCRYKAHNARGFDRQYIGRNWQNSFPKDNGYANWHKKSMAYRNVSLSI